MRFITVALSTVLVSNICLSNAMTANASTQKDQDGTHKVQAQKKHLLKKLDRNNDQRLSFIEAMEDLNFAENFLELDLNKDGYISSQELNAPQSMITGQLKHLLGSTALIQL
ncbi:hypothetical protein Q4583_12895 [Neptunomonas phycophila]|uniref:EF-hand domain-containing protein n=1 Tax=Neptunomonas phycophila TaxID=1572645 RepID=A0ABT9EUU3_9GAMM|nr:MULTISPECIES: hypothetical protein [Neptunomonas]MBT3146537.1 hypothetical protein [Neptunomonas phycophila]MDN2658808.1 hypothetical protein [Neptunomonas sp. CHC150]MDO6468998.1 hypothetical protein [Neptunomonas phycophila]MDO6785013.1 hypothetical protein [Neptunomonas phycophila]MDP2522682.1 hypothetical protein [Neptunomonas phycophila]